MFSAHASLQAIILNKMNQQNLYTKVRIVLTEVKIQMGHWASIKIES